jgi:hypothetical protein
VDDLSGFDAFDRVHQSREQWTVVFHAVPLDVDDDDPESELLKIVLVLKALIDGHQNVTLALGLCDQLGVWQRAPFGFGDGQDFMIGESLPQPGIDALV